MLAKTEKRYDKIPRSLREGGMNKVKQSFMKARHYQYTRTIHTQLLTHKQFDWTLAKMLTAHEEELEQIRLDKI